MDFLLDAGEYYYGHDNEEVSVDDFVSFIKHPFNRNKKFEFIDGRIVLMAGNASPNHQRIVKSIFKKFDNYLEGQICEVFFDLNLYLFREDLGKCENVYQPDILVNCDNNRITKRGCEGVPEFAAEVISQSTSVYDYHKKCPNYMRFGVKEFWVIDLFMNRILVYTKKGETDYNINEYTFYDDVRSELFPDLTVNFSEILEKLDKSELKWI